MDFTEEERKLIHELTQQPGWDLWMQYLEDEMSRITDFTVVSSLRSKEVAKLCGRVEFISEILRLKTELQIEAAVPESPLNPLEY